MEREQSIPHLEQEQTRLSKIIDQRRQLYDAIGTGRIKEGSNIITDIKMGRVKGVVEASRLRVETHLVQVQEDFNRLVRQQEEDLVLRADRYIDQVALFKAQLEELQKYSKHLNPATLQKHTQQLRGLESLPERDLELKTGLQLKQQRLEQERQAEEEARKTLGIIEFKPPEPAVKRPEVEEQPKTLLTLDHAERTVIIGENPKVKLFNLGYALLSYVYSPKHIKEEIPSQILQQVLEDAGSRNKNAVAITAFSLEQKLGQSMFRRMVKRTGGVVDSKWAALENFEVKIVVPPTSKEDEKTRRQEAKQLFDVTVDGSILKVRGKITADLLTMLADSSEDKQIPFVEVVKIMYGDDSPQTIRKGYSIVYITNKRYPEYNLQIVLSGKGKDATVYLKRIRPEQPKEQPTAPKQPEEEEATKRFPQNPFADYKIAAINAFIDNPSIALEEIMTILGPSRRTGKILTRQQALWALTVRGGVNLLYMRIVDKLATGEETSLWNRIKQGTHKEDNLQALRTFTEGLRFWFKNQKSVTRPEVVLIEQIEKQEIEGLTYEEALVLAALIQTKHGAEVDVAGKPFRFAVDQTFMDIYHKLSDFVPGTPSAQASYISLRPQILAKVSNILYSDKFDEILDSHPEEPIKDLIIWLYLQDEAMAGSILKFLSRTEPFVLRQTETEIAARWEELKRAENQPKKTAQLLTAAVVGTPQQPVTDNLDVTVEEEVDTELVVLPTQEPTPFPPFEQPPVKPKVPAIERRDPKIHETIDNFVSQVVEKLIGETFSGAQVNRAFQILKVTLVEWMLDKHIINPELNRDTIPQYTREDVVVMLYVNSRQQKGGLNKRHLADLKQLVGEQIKKRANSN